jgi:hypothetical protein
MRPFVSAESNALPSHRTVRLHPPGLRVPYCARERSQEKQ